MTSMTQIKTGPQGMGFEPMVNQDHQKIPSELDAKYAMRNDPNAYRQGTSSYTPQESHYDPLGDLRRIERQSMTLETYMRKGRNPAMLNSSPGLQNKVYGQSQMMPGQSRMQNYGSMQNTQMQGLGAYVAAHVMLDVMLDAYFKRQGDVQGQAITQQRLGAIGALYGMQGMQTSGYAANVSAKNGYAPGSSSSGGERGSVSSGYSGAVSSSSK